MDPLTPDETKPDASYFINSKYVKELSGSDFKPGVSWSLKSKECTVVLFYADWCPHCKKIQNLWEDLGKKAAFFEVVAMNCARHIAHCQKIKEELPGLIPGYPTIVFYKNGSPKETYDGERTVTNLLKKCMGVCSDGGTSG